MAVCWPRWGVLAPKLSGSLTDLSYDLAHTGRVCSACVLVRVFVCAGTCGIMRLISVLLSAHFWIFAGRCHFDLPPSHFWIWIPTKRNAGLAFHSLLIG